MSTCFTKKKIFLENITGNGGEEIRGSVGAFWGMVSLQRGFLC